MGSIYIYPSQYSFKVTKIIKLVFPPCMEHIKDHIACGLLYCGINGGLIFRFNKIALFVKKQVFLFHFSFVGNLTLGICNFPGF